MIYRRTQGNPFFCEELLAVMQKMGFIHVAGDRTRLIGGSDQLSESVVPNSVAGVLGTRIDQLPEPLQLTLKAANSDDPECRMQLWMRQYETLSRAWLAGHFTIGRFLASH